MFISSEVFFGVAVVAAKGSTYIYALSPVKKKSSPRENKFFRRFLP